MAAFLQWRVSEVTAEARPAMASGCGSVLRDEGERETKMNLRVGRADGRGSSNG